VRFLVTGGCRGRVARGLKRRGERVKVLGMLEKEAWGLLTEQQLGEFLTKFEKQFGKPKRERRLSISFWNHEHNDIDTRIRIINGKAEIVQKIGRWDNITKWERKEYRFGLVAHPEEVFNAYRVLRQLLPAHEPCQILQFENYLFKRSGFEIKLSRQTGKTEKYNFEVEVTDEKADLGAVLDDLGLQKLVTVTDVEFWDQWNQELNLNDKEVGEEKIRKLIKEYLKV
jgi:hypothetical protein